jgi:hypothetical protein
MKGDWFMPNGVTQSLRYVGAILIAAPIGVLIGVPLSISLDILWGGEVTGGRWPLTAPNVILIVIQSALIGALAAWIAGRRGKLIAGLAEMFPLIAFMLISIALNIESGPYERANFDTQVSLWVWIGLLPAVLSGHYAIKVKDEGGLGLGVVLIGSIMGMLAQFGGAAFHLYTCVTAYKLSGFGAAFISFVTPFISEVYWSWRIWDGTDTFWNIYTMRFGLLLAWIATGLLLATAGGLLTGTRKRQPSGVPSGQRARHFDVLAMFD